MRVKKKWVVHEILLQVSLSGIMIAHCICAQHIEWQFKEGYGKKNFPWIDLDSDYAIRYLHLVRKKTDADWKHDVDECVKLKLIFPLVGNGCGSKNTFEEAFDGRPDREQG